LSGAGYAPEGVVTVEGEPVDISAAAPLETALRIGVLNNRAALARTDGAWTIRGDPTEAALIVAGRKGGLDEDALRAQWPEVGELPFSSERMLMATFHRGREGEVTYTKGAPARIVERCNWLLTGAGPQALDAEG